MKKYIVIIIILFCNYIAFSQSTGTRTELPLYKIENKEFTSIIDSIVSFSERCEGKGLNFLSFLMNIQETQLDHYQIQVTMINCQDMNFMLTNQNYKNEVIGFLVHKNKDFLIIGCRGLEELFKPTTCKKIFITYGSEYLLKIDYTKWDYTYNASNNKFEMISFNPICVYENDEYFPICNDSISLIQK